MFARPASLMSAAGTRRIVNAPIAIMLVATLIVETGIAWATRMTFRWGVGVALQIAIPAAVALALRLFGRWRKLGAVADTILLWTVVAIVGAPLSYLAARAGAPLQDDLFIRADHALGFDGARWAAAIDALPWVRSILHFAYISLGVQVTYCCVIFPLTGEMRRFREFFWLSWLALLTTCAISAALPAMGQAARYGLDPVWRAHIEMLRTGLPITIDVTAMHGVIFFPSFHAAMAVIFVWVHRRSGAAGHIMLALNGAMLVSTLSEGDHYLIDVIAGVAMTAALIALVSYTDLARVRRDAR